MSEQVQGGTSKLRLSAARSNSRLLKGYGPLAALLVAFVLMAMLVPTKAPQQEVVHESQAGAATTGDSGATAGSTTATTAPGSTASGAAAGTAGGSAAAARGGGRARADGDGRGGGDRQERVVPGPARAGPRRPVLAAVHRVLGQQRRGHLAGRDRQLDQRDLPEHGGLRELPADAGLTRRGQHHRHHGRYRADHQRAGHLLRHPLPVLRAQAQHRVLQRPGLHHQRAPGQRPAAGRRGRRHGGPAAARLRRAGRRDRALRRGAGRPEGDLDRGALPVGLVHGPVRAVHVEPRHRVQRRRHGHPGPLPEVHGGREGGLRRGQPAEPAAQGGHHRPERPVVPDGGRRGGAAGGGGGLPGGGQHPVPAEPVHALEPGGHGDQPAAERRHHHGDLRL